MSRFCPALRRHASYLYRCYTGKEQHFAICGANLRCDRLKIEVEIMPENTSAQNGNRSLTGTSLRLKIGLAEMLKGGVIMDVMNVEQARIAEEAGATSGMAPEPR